MGEAQNQPQYTIQITSRKMVSPAIPTPDTLRNLKISVLDQFLPTVYLSYVLFYPSTELDQRAKNGEKIKQLENSLSEVLTLFYPLAGRYIKENFLIDCNDNGVEFIETQASGQLAPLLGRDVDFKKLIHLVANYQSESPTTPLIAVQCNMFECGGLAIGFRFSHRIIDGFGISKFIDGWATACRVGVHKVHRPSFDLATLLPTREVLPNIKLPRSITGLNVTSKTFVFPAPAITNLRAIARGGLGDAQALERQPSRVQLVIAVIWKALIRVAQTRHGQLRPSVISQTFNMRERTVLPISNDCFGNLSRLIMFKFTPDNKKSKVEFHDLVSLIGDAIANAVTDCAKPQSGNDFFSMVTNGWNQVAEEFNKDNVDAYNCSSVCRMPLCPDFGWGKATRQSLIPPKAELIFLMDTRDGDGIQASLYLEENKMRLLEQDPDIIAFTSHLTPLSLVGSPTPKL